MSDSPSPLGIQVDQNPSRTLVKLTGAINLRSSPELRSKLLELLSAAAPEMVVDLTDVPYMDSSGVGTLVELKRNVDKHKKKLTLAGMNPRVRGVFEISKLDRFFTITNGPTQPDKK
ncbi:MAG: STAS domain-containing protein [Deltaproteobacteria bacterium]|nr:STAS domain-containing protein [Deltaproteobacteria bacterium]